MTRSAATTNYQDLRAWRKAMELALEIYRCTRLFPRDELYGLTSQMRRAAVSVPSNIAEGKGRHSHKELLQFLYRARGSLLELNTQITIADELGYIHPEQRQPLASIAEEVGRMLNGLINTFQSYVSADSVARTPNT